jgi:hypothetical protein
MRPPASAFSIIPDTVGRRRRAARSAILLGDWETNRSAAVARLQVARDLVGFDEILKQPRDLLGDAIRAYAAGEPPPPEILSADQQELVKDCLYRAARGRTSVDHVVSEIVAGVRTLKAEFSRDMTASSPWRNQRVVSSGRRTVD